MVHLARTCRLLPRMIVLCLALTASARAVENAAPQLEITATTITARGITPGGTAVIVGSGRQQSGPRWGITRRQYLRADTDQDGVITLPQTASTAFIAWAVVDLVTGRHSVAVGPGTTLRRVDLARSIKRGPDGIGTSIATGHEFVEVLWVRPGIGAWAASVGDGGQADADRTPDGRTSCDLQTMRPIGKSPAAPRHMLPGDTVVIIDPFTTEIFATGAPK